MAWRHRLLANLEAALDELAELDDDPQMGTVRRAVVLRGVRARLLAARRLIAEWWADPHRDR